MKTQTPLLLFPTLGRTLSVFVEISNLFPDLLSKALASKQHTPKNIDLTMSITQGGKQKASTQLKRLINSPNLHWISLMLINEDALAKPRQLSKFTYLWFHQFFLRYWGGWFNNVKNWFFLAGLWKKKNSDSLLWFQFYKKLTPLNLIIG